MLKTDEDVAAVSEADSRVAEKNNADRADLIIGKEEKRRGQVRGRQPARTGVLVKWVN
jgi:hypothetical protein